MAEPPQHLDQLARRAVDCGLRIHRELGPGLLESVYEAILAGSLAREGIKVERQKPLAIEFDGLTIENGYRLDLLIEGQLIVEVKSVEQLAPVHSKQLLTYLRLSRQPIGLLMNFGAATFKEGVRRVVNSRGLATWRLGVNQNPLRDPPHLPRNPTGSA